jgi:hypothetical protein
MEIMLRRGGYTPKWVFQKLLGQYDFGFLERGLGNALIAG